MPIELETKAGIARMYYIYFPKIYNYVYYRIYDHDLSGDIVSGIFLRVLEHIKEFNPSRASFDTWIYTITRHAVIDYFRSRHMNCDIDAYADSLEYSLDFEDAYRLYTQGGSGEVEALVGVLNDVEQHVIHMRYFQGYNGKETAQRLDLNPSTERTIHERALKKMLRYLKAQGATMADMLESV